MLEIGWKITQETNTPRGFIIGLEVKFFGSKKRGRITSFANLHEGGKGGIRGSKITALELNYTALSIAARGRKIVAGEINFHSREIVIEEQ